MIAFLFILKKMCKIIVLSLIPQHFFKKKQFKALSNNINTSVNFYRKIKS